MATATKTYKMWDLVGHEVALQVRGENGERVDVPSFIVHSFSEKVNTLGEPDYALYAIDQDGNETGYTRYDILALQVLDSDLDAKIRNAEWALATFAGVDVPPELEEVNEGIRDKLAEYRAEKAQQ